MEVILSQYQNEFERFASQSQNNRRLWNISKGTGILLYNLIIVKKPVVILELGTSNGYSTFWLSLAAEKCMGTIHTIEYDEARFTLAQENLSARDNIKMHRGRIEDILPHFDEKVDFVFIDACKEKYHLYLELLLPIMNKGCILIADNIVSHSHNVKKYVGFLKESSIFSSVTIPIDSGLEFSVYLNEEE